MRLCPAALRLAPLSARRCPLPLWGIPDACRESRGGAPVARLLAPLRGFARYRICTLTTLGAPAPIPPPLWAAPPDPAIGGCAPKPLHGGCAPAPPFRLLWGRGWCPLPLLPPCCFGAGRFGAQAPPRTLAFIGYRHEKRGFNYPLSLVCTSH